MKELIKLYAVYNRDMNKELIRILSGLSGEELDKERNIYYKSIRGLFSHIATAEWYYVNAMLYLSGRIHPSDPEQRKEIFNSIRSEFSEAVKSLQENDQKLIDFANTASETDMKASKSGVKIYNGRIVDISVWEYMAQHMTHQIHHRGQLSQVLDEMGIEHDFGNAFPYVRDSE